VVLCGRVVSSGEEEEQQACGECQGGEWSGVALRSGSLSEDDVSGDHSLGILTVGGRTIVCGG
jgi:hypothetical protein